MATTRKTSSSTSSRRKTSTKPMTHHSSTASTSRPRRRTSSESSSNTANSRTASLRTDLKKFTDEEYASTDFTHGAMVMVQREGMDAIRAALTALMASKIPFLGSGLSSHAVDSLVNQLVDDYHKLDAAERKGLRAVIRWLSGDLHVDTETTTKLLTVLKHE
jgi:hypothetical protein